MSAEIAKRLREEVRTVEKMAFALKLVFPQADMMIQSDAHCLIEWMKDAASALDHVTSTDRTSP